MSSSEVEEDYVVKFREDEEMEFFMELALHETERWIQVRVIFLSYVSLESFLASWVRVSQFVYLF